MSQSGQTAPPIATGVHSDLGKIVAFGVQAAVSTTGKVLSGFSLTAPQFPALEVVTTGAGVLVGLLSTDVGTGVDCGTGVLLGKNRVGVGVSVGVSWIKQVPVTPRVTLEKVSVL